MKFKIIKGTETYEKFMVLKSKIDFVNAESVKLVESLGAQKFCKRSNIAYGGISAIQFEEKPQGWKKVGEDYQNFYFPKATEKVVNKAINELPFVRYDEINEIVGFKAPQTVPCDRGLQWIDCVGLFWGIDCIVIYVTEGAEYTPTADLVEILDSEYLRLKAEKGKK